MKRHCSYCDNLKSALDVANYCSHKNQEIQSIDSNAYYFSDNQLSSGDHISRFSIRAVYNGYQEYQVENIGHVIDKDKFLVINEGEHFENYIKQTDDVEGVIVAFNPNFLKYYLYYVNHGHEKLLDNPFEKINASFYFYKNSYDKSHHLDNHLKRLIREIRKGKKDPIFYQHIFLDILNELVLIEKSMHERIDSISALKGKTREELYRRLSTAKDFMDSNLERKLSIDTIAHFSCLSPFHFLRTFSDCYGITPYQYLKRERLKKASFLVNHSNFDLAQIISASGFENKRTFQRAYQKRFGKSPYSHLQEVRC